MVPFPVLHFLINARVRDRTNVWRHFAHFLKLFKRLLCHLHRYTSPSTCMYATRGYNGYLLAYFWILFCEGHTLRMPIPSYLLKFPQNLAFISLIHRPSPSFPSLTVWLSRRRPGTFSVSDIMGRKGEERN